MNRLDEEKESRMMAKRMRFRMRMQLLNDTPTEALRRVLLVADRKALESEDISEGEAYTLLTSSERHTLAQLQAAQPNAGWAPKKLYKQLYDAVPVEPDEGSEGIPEELSGSDADLYAHLKKRAAQLQEEHPEMTDEDAQQGAVNEAVAEMVAELKALERDEPET